MFVDIDSTNVNTDTIIIMNTNSTNAEELQKWVLFIRDLSQF